MSLLTIRDWKLALVAWRKFQVQVRQNPAISLFRTEASVRSFLPRSDVLEHFEAFVYGFNLEAHLPVPKLELSAKSRRKKSRLLANLKKGDQTSSEAPTLLEFTFDEELDLPLAAVFECMPRAKFEKLLFSM